MEEKLTIAEASQMLGMSIPQIRVLMQRKVLDIGVAIPPDEGHSKWCYYIYKSKVNKLIGKE